MSQQTLRRLRPTGARPSEGARAAGRRAGGFIRTALAVGIGAALAGCAVGPDFHAPDAPAVADASHPYTPVALPAQTASAPGPGGEAQRFVAGQDIARSWWETFHSPALDALVASALAHSPNLAAAQATLRQAEENYRATFGQLALPSVSGQLSATRERTPTASANGLVDQTVSLYNAGLDLSYTLDVFGGNRRQIEGARAAVDVQRFQVEATWLSLTSSVVATAIQAASLDAQLKATQEVVDIETRSLGVIERQVQLGALARSAVLQQRTLVAQTQAQLPPLQKSLAQSRHQLAVLTGRLPGDPDLPTFDLASLRLPHELPVSVPSDLVRQRPDIRASEATLHEASAQVGVATAALYPQITLSASLGREALTPGKLFSSGGLSTWSLAAGLTQPIFNGGALQAKRRAAIAAYDAASAQYRQTVLQAFLDVANALRAVDADAEALRADAQAEALARESLQLVERQYQLGAASYLASLDAQRTWLQTRVALAQAQAARYADTAALFQALGGGWWNAPDAVASAAATGASAAH
jgi:NodT family efflux transporter outer membrane factor (OMF) lipoprotein